MRKCKKMTGENVLCCIVVLVILMSAMAVSVVSAQSMVHIKGEVDHTQTISITQGDLEAYCSLCRCDIYQPPCCVDYEPENAGNYLVLRVKIEEIASPLTLPPYLSVGEISYFYFHNPSISVNDGSHVEIDIEHPFVAGFYSCVGGSIIPDKVVWDMIEAFKIIDVNKTEPTCDNPPTVVFDKAKYYEGTDTVYATVSTIHSSVHYEVKDCYGTLHASGYANDGDSISYTIPETGATSCCDWSICFYWDESINTVALDNGGTVTADSYDCGPVCYFFEVCPPEPTCDNPPTVVFDKAKYYEGTDTVYATVSTIHSSVHYEVKDCYGTLHASGYANDGDSISYTIPETGATSCCDWSICFYWDESINTVALDNGGTVTADSYDCGPVCYFFEVCPPEPTCDNPPTVVFDKAKYYEGTDTVYATVSTIHSSVHYEVKDCYGTLHASGYANDGDSISYTIPETGATSCCDWSICFYWDESINTWALDNGGTVTADSYDCGPVCYFFEVCPPEPTCDNPPTVVFDKAKYYEGTDTVYATVSTVHSSVHYEVKDCYGTLHASGYANDGDSISYTIPETGATSCCDWSICFYWDESINTVALDNGGTVTADSYDCGPVCYFFEVCPPEPTCDNPPTVVFDKAKYYEGTDTVYATVSTTHSSVHYEVKDCYGTLHASGYANDGDSISYTIPETGATSCCDWSICFYWDESINTWALDNGGTVTADSYDCGPECHEFLVCPNIEIKFNGTAIEYFSLIGAWGWNVTVDEIISGPSELQGHTVKISLASVNPDLYPLGFMDPNIEPGDKVEVYGLYQDFENVVLYGSVDYYLIGINETLTTIEVSPTTKTLYVDATQQFTATAKDQNGNPMPGILINWTSSNTTVGSVSPASAPTGSEGGATTTFTASSDGTTTVTASNGTVSGTASVVVESTPVQPLVVSIENATVNPGETKTVSIIITKAVNMATAEIWLLYDKDVVIVENVSEMGLKPLTYGINNTVGETQMNWFSEGGKTGNFLFASITLKAVGSEGQSSALDLDVKGLTDTSANSLSRTVNDGTVDIPKPKPKPTQAPFYGGGGGGGGEAVYIDTDGDRYQDKFERIKGSDPNDPCDPDPNCAACQGLEDTDGDGFDDRSETLRGTDPNDPCDPNPDCSACLAQQEQIPIMPKAKKSGAIGASKAQRTTTTPTPTPKQLSFDTVYLIIYSNNGLINKYGGQNALALLEFLKVYSNDNSAYLLDIDAYMEKVEESQSGRQYDNWEKVDAAIEYVVTEMGGDMIRYILIVGDDGVIPFYRVPDLVNVTEWNEASYAAGGLRGSSFYFTDDNYADLNDDGFVDVAIGRVLGDDIEQLKNMLSRSPILDNASLTAGGFPFDDAAISASLASKAVGFTVTEILEAPLLTQFPIQMRDKSLIFYSYHADHFGYHDGMGNYFLSPPNLMIKDLEDKEVAVVSMGCHSGFVRDDMNSSNSIILAWIGSGAKCIVSPSCYVFGDTTPYLVLTEEVVTDFTDNVLSGQSFGYAMMNTKKNYFAKWSKVLETDYSKSVVEKSAKGMILFGDPTKTMLPPFMHAERNMEDAALEAIQSATTSISEANVQLALAYKVGAEVSKVSFLIGSASSDLYAANNAYDNENFQMSFAYASNAFKNAEEAKILAKLIREDVEKKRNMTRTLIIIPIILLVITFAYYLNLRRRRKDKK